MACYPEHDLFIQLMKLKNTLREWMGEAARHPLRSRLTRPVRSGPDPKRTEVRSGPDPKRTESYPWFMIEPWEEHDETSAPARGST